MAYGDDSPQTKAAKASGEARRRRAAERREGEERHDRALIPGHHESCGCETCQAARAAMSDTETTTAEPYAELLRAIYEAVDPAAVPTGRDADEIRSRVALVRGVIQSITETGIPAEGSAETLRKLIAEIEGKRGERP